MIARFLISPFALRGSACVAALCWALTGAAQEFIWTQTSAPDAQWQFVTSSAEGNRLMAATRGLSSEIYVSSDAGVTWDKCALPGTLQWACGAESADGQRLFAAVGRGAVGGVYVSDDGGAAWRKTGAPDQSWWSIAASSDATKLLASGGGNTAGLFVSTSGIASWRRVGPFTNGTFCVGMSGDGRRMVAAEWGSGVYRSEDRGETWNQTGAPSNDWRCIAVSASADIMSAGAATGGLWTSSDGGMTWRRTSAPSGDWQAIVVSTNGMNQTAVQAAGVYTSTNAGATWLRSVTNDVQNWRSAAASSDGLRLCAVVSNGGIYTGAIEPSAPVIVEQPGTLVCCPGAAVTFEPVIAGTAPLDYQWLKDGSLLTDTEQITGTKTSRLSISSVSFPDVGSYRLLAANIVGAVTSTPMALIVGSSPAKATATITNGFVVGATVSEGGCGYTNNPLVVFSGGAGTGAAGYGEILDGSVIGIVVTNAGFGYAADAVAQVAPPGLPILELILTNTPAAEATPVVFNGFVIGANLTAPGNNYTSPPPVFFIDTTGIGASGYGQIAAGAVTNIVITNAGFGYSISATAVIAPAGLRNAVLPVAQNLIPGLRYAVETTEVPTAARWEVQAPFTATNATMISDYWLIQTRTQQVFRVRAMP